MTCHTTPRNALISGAAAHPARKKLHVPGLLASAIGHAAMLSDTPEKWAATVAMLKQNGVDPQDYEDFEKGRPAAMAAAGIQAKPEEETE